MGQFHCGKLGVMISTFALLAMGGCISLNSPAVQRVAQQNRINAEMLNANAKTLMAMTEAQFEVQRIALLRLHIANICDDIMAQINGKDVSSITWSDIMDNQPQWIALRDIEANGLLSQERIENLKPVAGWVLTAYRQTTEGGRFTPQHAFQLTEQTDQINDNVLLSETEKMDAKTNLWREFDPKLDHYEKMISDAHEILILMRRTIELQTTNADMLSRELFTATQSKADVMEAVGGIIESEEFGIVFDKLTTKNDKSAEDNVADKSENRKKVAQFLYNILKGKINSL